mgnify:CR=1 FL=1
MLVDKSYKIFPSNISFRGEIAYLKPGTPKADRFNGESTVYVEDFEGSKTNLEQLIGNAVPVKLAEYVGRCLTQYIANQIKKLFYFLNFHQVVYGFNHTQNLRCSFNLNRSKHLAQA